MDIIEDFEDIDFKMNEIESYSMNWETGKMTHRYLVKGEWVEEICQAMPPKSPMYYALKKMK